MRMKLFTSAVMSFSLLASAYAQARREQTTQAPNASAAVQSDKSRKMTITRGGARTPGKGSEASFTGNVSVEPLFPVNAPSRTSGGSVTFEPGARSAWHTHPLGQILIVTAGKGWVQEEGCERQEIRPGVVVWTPPGVKHWHGATATERLTHLAIQVS